MRKFRQKSPVQLRNHSESGGDVCPIHKQIHLLGCGSSFLTFRQAQDYQASYYDRSAAE